MQLYREAEDRRKPAYEKVRRENSHCQYDLWCERKRNLYSVRSSFKACHWDKIMQMWTFTAVHTEHCELWSLRVQELNLQPELDHSLLPHNRTPLYRRSNSGGRRRRERRKKQRESYEASEEGVLTESIVMGQIHDLTWCLYSSLHLFPLTEIFVYASHMGVLHMPTNLAKQWD